jgi:pimeloyl-ACP methyl ester carboxylesterase
MRLRIVGAVFKKDLLSLLPLVLTSALLFAGDAVITRLDLLPVWSQFGIAVLQVALLVLVLAIFQLDSPASLTDDWLCRPLRVRELLAAKFALLICAVYLPRALGALVADLTLGLSLGEALQDALLLPPNLLPHLLLIFLFTAIVTRNLVQGFGVLFAMLIAVFVVPTPFLRPHDPTTPGIREELWMSGISWLATTPAVLACLLLLVLAFWLVYRRRRIALARVLLGVAFGGAILFVVLPMALLPWETTFALQKTLGPQPRAGVPEFSLHSPNYCLPSVRREELATDAAFLAAIRKTGLVLWEDEALRGLAPDAVAFLTQVQARGLPLDWRVKLNYVQARNSALRPATYLTDRGGGALLSHTWMLPKAIPGLHLTYSLTLLAPEEHSLPIDGQRRALPGIGYCSARREADHRIHVDCFQGFSRTAQISAELPRIPATRDYSAVDFSPGWTRALSGKRVKLAIGSSRLTSSDHVTVTAWHVAGYVDPQITLPGTCPLSEGAGVNLPAAHWRDTAPHQAHSIHVEPGVQLEVLDFGGEGSPVVLLPGLGATAHSFDELAPLLSPKHRVLAITRRGSGYSSRPDFGFDTPRLAQDVLGVMDALQLDKALLVGHSIAGEELTWLGGHHPGRFSGLVYLDAAYDRSADPSGNSRLRALSRGLPPEPPIPPDAMRNYHAMSKLLAERGRVRLPEGELIAFWNVDKPFLAGTPAMDPRTQQAMLAAIRAPDYAAVKIPALAVYALEDADKPLPPWYDANDAGLRATLTEIARVNDTLKRENIEQFRRGVGRAQILELRNASHYVIQSNPREVLEAIEEFAGSN